MLFSYKFFTFSQPFSQLPNKFYIKKSTTTHTPPQQQQQKSEIKERKIKRLREREIDREREIGLQRRRRDRFWVGQE